MMSNLNSIRGILVLFLYLLAGTAAAQPTPCDAELKAGEGFAGRIAFSGDEDRVTVPCLAGAELTVKVESLSGQQLHPKLQLLKDGDPVTIGTGQIKTKSKGKVHKYKKIPIEDSGVYEVRVAGAGGTLGDYHLKVVEGLPDDVAKKLKLDAGVSAALEFPARPGATVCAVLTARKKDGPLEIPELRRPDGARVQLEGLVQLEKDGRRLVIGPVALGDPGVYRLVVRAGLGGSQSIKVRLSLCHQPFTSGAVVQEAAGHAAVSGSVTLSEGYWMATDSDGYSAEEILVRVDDGVDAAQVAARLGCEIIARGGHGWVRLRRAGAAVVGCAETLAARQRVRDLYDEARLVAGVRHAQPNHLRQNFAVPNDPLYNQQWDLAVAEFEAAWTVETGDASRTVAVLDTGIRFEHPDLAGRLTAGFDFVGDSWNAGDGNGYDGDPTDVFVSVGTHGTHVAGTVAAVANNGIGVAGGVWAGKVMPVRVLGVLGGTDFDIAQGVLYAAGLPNASGGVPPARAEVINMSLGGPTYSEILHQAVRDAVEAGVVVVAAAGNAASHMPMYPAAFSEVIAVSATDAVDELTYYSSFGEHVDIAAPGGDKKKDKSGDGKPDEIVSTVVDPALGPTYAGKTGTSMAAPHVAAAAFLIRSVNPALSTSEVEAYLAAGAKDLGSPGRDELYGHGRLDTGRSVAMAAGIDVGPTAPFAAPALLAFAEDVDQRQVAVINQGGDGSIQVSSVTSNAFWLQPLQFTGQTPVTLAFQVSRAGLAPGTYSTVLQVTTSAGPLSIPVTMDVENSGAPIAVKEVYVLAVDVITDEPVAVQKVTEATADLFTLDPLPEGTYRVFATTDFNYNGILAESHDYAGEVVDPATFSTDVVLRDGFTLSGAAIVLKSGVAHKLPGGGNIHLPGQ